MDDDGVVVWLLHSAIPTNETSVWPQNRVPVHTSVYHDDWMQGDRRDRIATCRGSIHVPLAEDPAGACRSYY